MEIFIQEDIISMVQGVLNKCDSILFSEGTTVYILPIDLNSKYFLEMDKIKGCTSSNGKIILFINLIDDGWERPFPQILADKYYHSVCSDRNFEKNFTMLENLLLEGRAQAFVEMLYPGVKVGPGLTSPLPIIKEKEMWDEIKENLNSVDPDYQKDIMFGGVKRIPKWCGYRIGYSIMQEFIKNNPDISVEEWTSMKAEEILDKSGYEESLEKRLEEYSN